MIKILIPAVVDVKVWPVSLYKPHRYNHHKTRGNLKKLSALSRESYNPLLSFRLCCKNKIVPPIYLYFQPPF
jgi:hypothetical protein